MSFRRRPLTCLFIAAFATGCGDKESDDTAALSGNGQMYYWDGGGWVEHAAPVVPGAATGFAFE
mgnify:FL=1